MLLPRLPDCRRKKKMFLSKRDYTQILLCYFILFLYFLINIAENFVMISPVYIEEFVFFFDYSFVDFAVLFFLVLHVVWLVNKRKQYLEKEDLI